MDAQESVVVLQLAATGTVLCYASFLDWRTRRVGNVFWLTLSVAALLLLVARVLVDEAPLEYLLVLIPILAILADVYGQPDEPRGIWRFAPVVWYTVAVISTLYLAYLWIEDDYFAHLLTAPVMMVVVVLMYMLDIVKGGADAKALIALSVMFPFYPELGELPMISAEDPVTEVFMPFSFIVLVTAAIVVAVTPIAFAMRNIGAREFSFPQGLLGYRLDAEEAKRSHVWLMEHIEDGMHIRYTRPRGNEDLHAEVDKLVAAGHRRVWVTPKVPFIVPMTAAFIFTATVGNILVVLMGL